MSPTTATIRVMIIDDNEIVRLGLSVFLETCEDMELIGTAKNGKEGIDLCEKLKPEVILLDMMMPEMTGLQALPQLREVCPDTRIIGITAHMEEDIIKAGLEAGIDGFLLKDSSIDSMSDAIRRVHRGERVVGKQLSRLLGDSADSSVS
jgi:NarL family two-component system response regulator LiaR